MNTVFIRQFELGEMANFNYIIVDQRTKKAALVDPWEEAEPLLETSQNEGWEIMSILLTHGHFDHIGGVATICADLNVPVYISRYESKSFLPKCNNLKFTEDKEIVRIGETQIECILTPGHSPGCQCFYVEKNLLTGDTLFIDAIGRTDLPGGDPEKLFQSLQIIKGLPDTTIIWPGHNYGARTSHNLAALKHSNPYLSCSTLEKFLMMVGY